MIVTETFRAGTYGTVMVTYDNSLIKVSFDPNGHTELLFLNGVGILRSDTNISFHRDDRDTPTVLTNVDDSPFTVKQKIVPLKDNADYLESFTINLGLSATKDYTIDTENANLFMPDPDPDPEPDPEPKKRKVYKSGDKDLYYLEIISSDNIHSIITDTVDVPEGSYEYRINSLSGYEIVSLQLEFNNSPESNEIRDIEISSGTVNVEGNFDISRDVYFRCTVQEVSDDEGVVPPFNELYKVDSTILYNLNKKLIANEFMGVEMPSLSPYIINLLELPFRINVTEIQDSIKVGNVNFTDVIANKINRDLVEINLGEINIPELTGNSYDYLNTDVFLHLPYSDKISIPLEYAISETISIKYLIDLYSGECNITLRSTKINNVFHNGTTKIGRNIPFFHKQSDQILNQQSIMLPVNNDLSNAYIEILRNKPVENGFDSLVKDSSILSDFTGYLVVDDIELETSANQNDREEIKNILRNGVYIK